jgi:hypothetical protein
MKNQITGKVPQLWDGNTAHRCLAAILNYANTFPAACGGVSEHNKNKQLIDDSSPLAARRINYKETTE